MKVIQANSSHKEVVIDLLDEFVSICHKIIKTGETVPKRDNYGNPVFDNVINSPHSAIFLAQDEDNFVGILTIHIISLIRKWNYKYAEIEEMFVQEKYQWSEVASKLMKSAKDWAESNDIISIQLKSHNLLKRAHSFYGKHWFESYGKVFELRL